MRLRSLLLAGAVAIATLASAQSTTPQPPPASADKSSAQPGAMRQGQDGMGAMHGQHTQDMKQSIARMKALLDLMKANAAGLSGKEKAAMDANVQLWQMMIDHMEEMANHMGMMNMDMGHGQKPMPQHPMGPMPPPPPPPPTAPNRTPSEPPPPPQK